MNLRKKSEHELTKIAHFFYGTKGLVILSYLLIEVNYLGRYLRAIIEQI